MPRSQSWSSLVVRGRSRRIEKESDERRGEREAGVEVVEVGEAVVAGEEYEVAGLEVVAG